MSNSFSRDVDVSLSLRSPNIESWHLLVLSWNNEDSVFQDFATQPIISEAVFYSIDRNKDGYITKGELKLASRGTSMKKLSEIIDEIDNNSDGKLTLEEVKAIAKKAHRKKTSEKSSKN